jgi:hypothetical protein
MRPGTLQSFTKVEQELQQERAAALGRIGKTLEELIAKSCALQIRIETASTDDRVGLVAEYRETWARARTYRWYLEVQREAIGLRRHERLDEMYRLPAAPDNRGPRAGDRGHGAGREPGDRRSGSVRNLENLKNAEPRTVNREPRDR